MSKGYCYRWGSLASAALNHASKRSTRLSEAAATVALGLSLGLIATPLGCHIEDEGLTNILASNPTYVNFPGMRLVKGRVSNADNDFVDSWESRVTALRDNGELVIIDIAAKKSCSVGVVADYLPFRMTDGFVQSHRPLVAFLETKDSNSRGELSFSDWDCNVWSTGLLRAELPSRRAAIETGYLLLDARDDGDTLVVANPWMRNVTEVAAGLTAFRTDYSNWFSQEGTDFVVRNADLSERLRVQNVAAALPLVGSKLAVLMTNGLLFVENLLTGGVQLVARDACDLSDANLNVWTPVFDYIVFRAPCSEGTLQLYDHATDTLQQVGAAGQFADVRVAFNGKYLYVLEKPTVLPSQAKVGIDVSEKPARYLGTLWGASVETAASSEPLTLERLGERALLPVQASFGPFERLLNPLILAEYDGTVGRLLEWRPGFGTNEVATNARELDGGLALVNWDGMSGDVLVAMVDPQVLLPLRLTSLSAATLDSGGPELIAATVATATGELIRIRGSWESWHGGSPPRLETIASGVFKGQYGWYIDRVLGYTRDIGADTGTLVVRFTETDDVFEQAGVARWQYSWPDLGILYFVDAGTNAGLWFAPFR